MPGIVSYGAYVPRHRLAREGITTPLAVGVSASAKGVRSVAGFDEDTTSMGIEAARVALHDAVAAPCAVYFATTRPAYLEKSNASVMHAALGLDRTAGAYDVVGAIRSGAAAIQVGLSRGDQALVVLSDIRTSLPGGADERDGGDAAVALTLSASDQHLVAELLASASLSEEFLDRWRPPDESTARRWEERFGQEIYQRLGVGALGSALKQAGLAPAQIDYLAIGCANTRALKQFARASGVKPGALVDDLIATVGNTGMPHAALQLAGILDRAEPDAVIAVVVLADGADVWLFRATPELARRRSASPLVSQVAGPTIPVSYTTYLTWRGLLVGEQPRRPDPADPAAPTTLRATNWKLRFSGSRCKQCGEVHYPPQRVCQKCGAVDQMEAAHAQTGGGTVITSVVDRLAWSPSPPITVAVINLDGGGRVQLEVTEADGVELGPGSRVELTFRRLFTTRNGIHNYFWKMRPAAMGKEV